MAQEAGRPAVLVLTEHRSADNRDVALERFVHAAADERVSALCPMVESTFDKNHPDLEASRLRCEQLIGEIMDRAKEAGRLRTDVGIGDLMVAVAQLSRPPAGTLCLNVDRFVHRHLQLFLDGLRAGPRAIAIDSTTATSTADGFDVQITALAFLQSTAQTTGAQ